MTGTTFRLLRCQPIRDDESCDYDIYYSFFVYITTFRAFVVPWHLQDDKDAAHNPYLRFAEA